MIKIIPTLKSTLILTLGLLIAYPGLADGKELSGESLMKRLNALTLEDPDVQKQFDLFPNKRKQLEKAGKKQQSRLLGWAKRKIKISYIKDGGAVLAPPVKPIPWLDAKPQPILSFGLFPCYNNLDEAKRLAQKSGRPILILSTELPGCSACTGHGKNQLAHPFVIDAAMEFIPVVVSGGWPYLAVLDTKGKQIGERSTHKTSIAATLKMMCDGLLASKRDVPQWLEFVTHELNAKRETTAFAMGCFWSGERKLGGLDGVLATRVGGRKKKGEWVEVEFDPSEITYEELIKKATAMKCTSAVIARTDEQAKIAKKYVTKPERIFRDDKSLITRPKNPAADKHSIYKNTHYGYLPMTLGQATRINAKGKTAEVILSPSQILLLKQLKDLRKSGKTLSTPLPKPDWSSPNRLAADANSLRTALDGSNE